MKGDKMAKRSSFGSIMRRRLSDITNSSLPQPKSPQFPENLPPDTASAKEIIDHLVKEKMALVKLIQDKNKIIELSGIEIQNLRTCLQKMQLQNWNLAQTNSHMLAELNLGRERLKSLQHEIACKEALLKTKNLQLKAQEEVTVQKTEVEVNAEKTEVQEPEVVTRGSEINEDTGPSNASRRRRPSRSRSLGSSTTSQQHAEKEAAVSKRRCLRRQSASSRTRHEEAADNLFEIDEAKFPDVAPSIGPAHEVVPSLLTSSSHGVPTDTSHVPELEAEARRTSISRPLRKAVEKVQSYRETSINVKMRRLE